MLLTVFAVAVCAVAAGGALAQSAGAEAVAGPENTQGPSGLPDGRIYEQVSPTNKFGNEAAPESGETPPYMVSGVDGNEVVYFKNGPFGETPTGFDFFSIARRFPTGWQSHSAVSRGEGLQQAFRTNPQSGLGFSADMTASVFGAEDTFVPGQDKASPTPRIYRYSEDGLVQWVGKPTISEPIEYEGFGGKDWGAVAGTSSDLNTIYFAFEGALVPADDVSNPALGDISYADELRKEDNNEGTKGTSYDNLYRWHEGTLEAAGVLPDGHLDPFGAVPAATLLYTNYGPEALENQVSEDGDTAFFLSPDPGSKAGRPSELYVRRSTAGGVSSTTLVSRDLLLPPVSGESAQAPTGASFLYASLDGSHVFFESPDQLTASAPNETTVKAYEFDTNTDVLTYLPGVADLAYTPCVNCSLPFMTAFGASRDGSNFIFYNNGKLELWNEGAVTEIAAVEGSFGGSIEPVMRETSSGGVYVFQLKAAFPGLGFNNGNGEYEEVYRYVTADNTLSCISCPPAGVTPSGDSELSHAFPSGNLGNTFVVVTGSRAISKDASRIVFDTPDPLVGQDTNGVRDAYLWEDGTVSLTSTGVSQRASFAGDLSNSGNDVFFSTTEGFVATDGDAGYDVYDARVPRPGDQLPPSEVSCEGAVCQGPPSVPQLLSPPASETFNGAGDLAPPPKIGLPKSRSLTRQQKLARALKSCRSNKDARKRAKCLRGARKRYGAKSAVATSKANRHRNGRGK